MNNIDVDQIMQEIRDDIHVRQIDGTVLPFDEIEIAKGSGLPKYTVFSYQKLDEIDNDMNSNYEILTDMFLIDTGGLQGKAKYIIKKVVRKFLIPVVEEQNKFNAFTTKGMNMLLCFVQESIRYRKKVSMLEEQVAEYPEQMAALKEQVEDCKRQIAALQKQLQDTSQAVVQYNQN